MSNLRDYIADSDEMRNTLSLIEEELKRLFGPSPPSDPYTPHGLEHAKKVEEYLDMLVSDESKRKLSKNEIFHLLLAIYCHDIGMATHRDVLELNPDPKVKEFVKESGIWKKDVPRRIPLEILHRIRKHHPLVSMFYLRDHGERLGIKDGPTRYIVGQICKQHDQKWQTDNYFESLEKSHKFLTLSALLRLADILHSDYTRIEAERLHIELFFQLPKSSWIHWAKHIILQSVCPRPSEGIIELLFVGPQSTEHHLLLRQLVEDIRYEIFKELETTRAYLQKVGAQYYDVRANLINNSREEGPLTIEEERRVIFFLNQYGISQQISAGGMEKSLLLSIREIVGRKWTPRSFVDNVVTPVRILLDFTFESKHGNLKAKRIGEEIMNILDNAVKIKKESISDVDSFVSEVKDAISQRLDRFEKSMEEDLENISYTAKSRRELKLSEHDCILLFSYSTMVASALKGILSNLSGSNSKVKILIAECRPKCVTPFSDAIAYVNSLSDYIDKTDIRFISDISIGYYLRHSTDYRISKVFLGFGDAWFSKEEKKFFVLNTVGSDFIARIARENGAKNIFIGSLRKFSFKQPPFDRYKGKSNFYLKESDLKIDKLLTDMSVDSFDEVSIDPVQEIVSSDLIDLLITENKCYTPKDFINIQFGIL